MEAELHFSNEEWESILKSIKSKLGVLLGGGGVAINKFAKIISVPVFKDVMDHFDKEQGPQKAWKAWSDSYTEHMNRIGRGGNNILQFDGRLRNSFKPSSFKIKSGEIYWYNDAMTKTGFPYAFAHDLGDGKNLPQRQFMWLSPEALERVGEIALDWLQETDVK